MPGQYSWNRVSHGRPGMRFQILPPPTQLHRNAEEDRKSCVEATVRTGRHTGNQREGPNVCFFVRAGLLAVCYRPVHSDPPGRT